MPISAGRKSAPSRDERLDLARDDMIDLSPSLDKIHLFDAESGKALA